MTKNLIFINSKDLANYLENHNGRSAGYINEDLAIELIGERQLLYLIQTGRLTIHFANWREPGLKLFRTKDVCEILKKDLQQYE